ncbi:Peptidase M20, dimerization domain [Pseudocohnilembus persalinus]|uniref:Peptidase M20, dimerization domain n=1 Tax=Pseudocohnilembus persalinus TaxID=266149 RepID=A0A0V0QTQ5_PSEPJ|nr:Peptidase M20, dimerization domain [Pseudocohnilembus persalinus]|eukprot:KRX05549.1 Peptidase M20, dimerization domain [Pseudocohnilembus persalinus]
MESQQQVNIRPEVKEIEEQIIQYRRQIHQYPETAYEEIQTGKFIVEQLQKHTKNLQIIQNVGKTGVVAILKGNIESDRCILFRADIDALNLEEDTNLPFKSKIKGKHHACGHDGHTAMLLGAAIIADKWVDKIKGTIKFCFQPAEEGGAGAKAMINDEKYPVLQNPEVQKCYAIHLTNGNYPPFIGIAKGPATASSDRITIDIIGKGSHAMLPDQGIDAMMIGCQLVQSLYTITSRNIDPTHPFTLSIGKIEGGTSANIVSAKCHIEGTTRALHPEDREIAKNRIQQIIDGFKISYQCEIKYNYKKGYDITMNDIETADHFIKSASKIKKVETQQFGMAGEDFSYFTLQKPCAYFTIGSALPGNIQNNGKTVFCGHHSPTFDFDEKCLAIGCSVWVQLIEDKMINFEDI